jgi:hypothetical protein
VASGNEKGHVENKVGYGRRNWCVPFHIYMIARRPRISLDLDSIVVKESTISGNFRIHMKDKYTLLPFNVPNQLGAHIRFEGEYPFTEFKIFDRNNVVRTEFKAAVLLTKFVSEGLVDYPEGLDLEIVYIGQSFGNEGSRTAPLRLQSHSTLQEIYMDCMRKTPDKDIWLILWSFEGQLISGFGGAIDSFGTSPEQDEVHVAEVFSTEVTEQQRVNFTEAALIRYFAPEYNDKFKYNFPNPAHTSYSECYDLDLNMVAVTLDANDTIATRLYSSSVPSSYLHTIQYGLHSRDERKGMFEFF